jgi:hypothetical protein
MTPAQKAQRDANPDEFDRNDVELHSRAHAAGVAPRHIQSALDGLARHLGSKHRASLARMTPGHPAIASFLAAHLKSNPTHARTTAAAPTKRAARYDDDI